jgi:hypothetical protein
MPLCTRSQALPSSAGGRLAIVAFDQPTAKAMPVCLPEAAVDGADGTLAMAARGCVEVYRLCRVGAT